MTDTKQLLTDCIGTAGGQYLLNQSQIGLYFYCKSHPDSVAYNLPSACDIPKQNMNLERLTESVRQALNNHVAFRCHIEERDGLPYWVEDDRRYDDLEIPVTGGTDAELADIKFSYAKPFDVTGNVLFRVEIFETETEYCILSDFHHLIYDGTSCGVWFREINQAYLGQPIAPETVTMLDYCAFDAAYAETDAARAAGLYYKELFAGKFPRTTLPRDLTDTDTAGDGYFVYSFGKHIVHADIHRLTNGKVGAFFIGAYAWAAAKFLNAKESVIYTGNHGRFDARMANTAGMFVRMLPVYMTADADLSVRAYLEQAAERLYGVIKKGNYAFGNLMKEYGLSIDMSVLYQGDFFSHVEINGMSCPWEALPLHGMDDDLCLMVFKEGEYFKLKAEYRKDKYKEETIRSFLRTYESVVAEFIARLEE